MDVAEVRDAHAAVSGREPRGRYASRRHLDPARLDEAPVEHAEQADRSDREGAAGGPADGLSRGRDEAAQQHDRRRGVHDPDDCEEHEHAGSLCGVCHALAHIRE
jgi:hypothetical protein